MAAAVAIPCTSAAGVIALLEEPDETIRVHALQKLLDVVDICWAEVASAVPLIEELSEDSKFSAQELASAVGSKCFFHLEEYYDALRLALGAGPYFDVTCKSEYVATLVSKCIDEYTALRVAAQGKKEGEAPPIDPRMEAIMEKMFERCFADEAWEQAMGISLESCRLDMVEETLQRCTDKPKLLAYTLEVCQTLVGSRELRLQVLRILVKLHREQPEPDQVAVCRCLQFLDEARLVAEILKGLIKGSEVDALLAYQIAFDLVESQNGHFLIEVNKSLPQKAAPTSEAPADGQEEKKGWLVGWLHRPGMAADGAEEAKADAMETDAPAPDAAGNELLWERAEKLNMVLRDGFSVALQLTFLYKMTQSDPMVLGNIKRATENRNSVLHNSTVVAHCYMNAGTTVDAFLRDNLDWMGRASNWAKFTATASIGVVHKGHVKESMNLLQPYLPLGGVSASPYSEGGALYALGLIHAGNAGSGSGEVTTYLSNALRNAGSNETVQHGACLGMGLAAMATGDETVYEDLKNTLYLDSAVAGEAAALSIGLLMMGLGDSTPGSRVALGEMLAYAKDTAHEKIIRGLALCIALTMCGREEAAETMIEQLMRDRDRVLRYGAMYTIGLAYCGTSNNNAIRRLLHVAVSDVSDDVRMAAVTNLGFVMFRSAEQVPSLVSLLAESFNAHVRYGSCMAVGIACAGTGMDEAMEVLEPLLEDAVDFVRQGAMLATAMVMMQQSEARSPKVKTFREMLKKHVTDKHQSTMSKMGAILATGLLDASGRNVTISMQSRAGFTKYSAVVGMAIWCQHWYWYPLMHFISLAFTPTMVLGLNKDFKMPNNVVIDCAASPSQFAYPKKLEAEKTVKQERVTTVTLSTTAKAKAREARKKKAEEGAEAKPSDKMDVSGKAGAEEAKGGEAAGEGDEDSEKTPLLGDAPAPGKDEKPAEADDEEKEAAKKKEPEPDAFTLANPSRVTPTQEPYVSFAAGQRYIPVRQGARPVGIVVLVDTRPEDPEDVTHIEIPSVEGEEAEAEPPEPFEWSPDN
ncbi:unnamed protein product [Chrysoparadoxa australica]